MCRPREDDRNGNRGVVKYAAPYKGRFRGSCVITLFRINGAVRDSAPVGREGGDILLEYAAGVFAYRLR